MLLQHRLGRRGQPFRGARFGRLLVVPVSPRRLVSRISLASFGAAPLTVREALDEPDHALDARGIARPRLCTEARRATGKAGHGTAPIDVVTMATSPGSAGRRR
jgi:hypothetical protein